MPFIIGIYLLTVLLDFLDGYAARKLKQETELGKVLDPVADKLLVLTLLVVLTVRFGFPLWLTALVILRDFTILTASLILYQGKKTIHPSIFVGKVTFALLGLLIFVYLIDLPGTIGLMDMKRFLIALNFSFLLWSWLEYCRVYLKEKNVAKKDHFSR
jgi:CDP-diacylglycerol--glycerol-3-phosphate 3-phosphatidyltransferase